MSLHARRPLPFIMGELVKKTDSAEWLANFLEGKRVWLYGGHRVHKREVIVFVLSLLFGLAEVILITREAGFTQLMLLPIFTALIIFGAIYERGQVIHSSIQLSDISFFMWDWRNQSKQIEYKNIVAVECVNRFQHAKVSICLHQDQMNQLEWEVLLIWHKGAQIASAVATELARRAELTKRSERLWTTAYEEVLPQKLFWE